MKQDSDFWTAVKARLTARGLSVEAHTVIDDPGTLEALCITTYTQTRDDYFYTYRTPDGNLWVFNRKAIAWQPLANEVHDISATVNLLHLAYLRHLTQ